MTTEGNPVSIFSKIHSSAETSYTSINDVTFSALERGASMFEKATFAMDRGYDDNKIFLKLDELKQYPQWLALYKDNMDYKYHFDMWQYTSSGKVPGISGKADINIYFPPENIKTSAP
jgi:hypothetical protein